VGVRVRSLFHWHSQQGKLLHINLLITELVWILGYKAIWQRAEKLGAVDVIVGADIIKLPSYDQPPVTEVACSVLFDSIEGLLSPHIGLLWQRFQPEYPFCDDVAPIAPRIETLVNKILSLWWNSLTFHHCREFGLSVMMGRELSKFSEIDLSTTGERLAQRVSIQDMELLSKGFKSICQTLMLSWQRLS
jgi:hypothetical protein